MKKNAKIIQISGIRGLLFVVFVVTCLIMGFVAFPGLVAMCLWNMASSSIAVIPEINIFQGMLLWSIIAITIYMSGGGKTAVAFKKPSQLDDNEIRDLMSKIRTQSQVKKINSMLLKSDEIKEIEKVDSRELKNSEHENNKEKL